MKIAEECQRFLGEIHRSIFTLYTGLINLSYSKLEKGIDTSL